MGPKTEKLIGLLEHAAAKLRDDGDAYHAGRVQECLNLLLCSDFRGIGRVLSVFNARGSLSDVAKPPLGRLGGEIWELADDIRRDVERDLRKSDE